MNDDKDDKGRDTRPRRMIYLQMWLSQEFAELDTFGRLLWIGVITAADDHGRLRADARLLRAKLFPRDDPPPPIVDIARRLEQMSELGLLRLYENEGEKYAEIINWTEFQHLKRPRKTFIPPPPDETNPSVPSCTLGDLGVPSCTLGVENGGTGIGIGIGIGSRKRNPSAPRADRKEACQEVPETPPQGDPESPEEGGGPPGGALFDPVSCSKGWMEEETHDVQRAWTLILEQVAAWGPVLPSTLRALAARTRVSPVHALAMVLDINDNEKLNSKWGAGNHALKEKWCPSEVKLAAAKQMLNGRAKRRNGPGTIGDTLKEMGGET